MAAKKAGSLAALKVVLMAAKTAVARAALRVVMLVEKMGARAGSKAVSSAGSRVVPLAEGTL